MRWVESADIALQNIAAHKVRSGLTMLGIVFGVGAVIAMLSIGAGAERQALETISRLGLNNVVVRATEGLRDEELEELRSQSQGLSLRDAEAIVDAVPGARLVSPQIRVEPYHVLSREGTTEANVYGVSEQHAELVDLKVSEGRFLDPWDRRHHEQVAVIGDNVRRDLFGYGAALGRHLKVDDLWFEVVGVLDGAAAAGEVDSFQGVSLASTADAIYVPVSTVLRKIDRRPLQSPLSEIVVHLEPGTSGRQTAKTIDGLLRHLHANADDYEIIVPEALLAESRRTQQVFNLVMGCIAGISLLVGGIGIMNIMLASVLERTREIGMRRAVGATRRDIQVQFLCESFALSAIGGVIGVLMGLLIAKAVAASAGWPTLVQAWAIVLSTSVALAVGLISGIYPARQAANLDPIDALRYE